MIRTAMLVLVLSLPGDETAPAGPQAAVEEAIEAVDVRLAVLAELEARRAAGERITLDALRSAKRTPSGDEETLAQERAAIENLRDAIRVAAEERSRSAAPRPAAPETARPGAGGPEAAPEPASPVDLLAHGPLALRVAEARYRAGDITGALALYDEMAQSGEDTWARLRRGRCLERLGRVDEARTAYEALVRDHPDDHWAGAARWSLDVLALARSGDPEAPRR